MKRTFLWLLPLILAAIVLQACRGTTSKKSSAQTTPPPQVTPNLQATIDEAVVSTCGAFSGLQATQDAVSATETAIEAFLQSVNTPIPTEAVEDLAEDQLEAMIAERVQMANKAATLAAEKSIEAVKDGTISAKEQEILYTYWSYTEEVIAYANEAIQIYYDVYAGLAVQTMAPLKAIDADLQAITQQTQAVLPLLEQIGLALEQGQGQKDKVLDQIEDAAVTVQTNIIDAQAQTQTWTASLPLATQQRVAQALAVKPKGVAKNHKTAVKKARDYVKSVQTAIADQKITQAELDKIAQQGANAAASLAKKGGEPLSVLAGSVNEITSQIASGQLPAARASLESFQAELSANP
jgi:hypothetical protein